MSQTPAELKAAVAVLESQRGLLGDAVVDAAVAGLRAQLQATEPVAAHDSETAPTGAAPEQALRLVSILFLDVVGSTSLGQRLDPEDIHAVMDGALARFTAVVQAHGGRVLQYAGDNLLAGFGAGEVHEDDAERAVRCGLALLAEGRRVGQQVQAAHGHRGFDVRVGIHSGPVLLGGGVDAEGSIRGSAVNIAARMEQSAEPGSLLVSVDTYRLVQGRFDVQAGQALAVKGIAAPLLTYRVDRERPRSAQALRRGLEGVTAALVGRDADLAQLLAAWSAVQFGRQQQVLTLLGEAGLGKTRLGAEFEAALLAAAPATPVLRASAQTQGLHQPYGVVRDLLFRRFDVQDSDPLDVAQAKLSSGLAPLLGDRAPEHTALLGQLIGLDFSASPFIAGILQDGRQLRARAFHAWVEYLRLLCTSLQPPDTLLLLLDDLHWADDGSLDAVQHLAHAGRDLPLLLLCAARPELLERRP
ncbi:MAG: adenylate/guanylate cyclase domain-containing protein, partial [Rubrivivax sp.]|nr:adenylate/guanylate cyclase domain-containing protein [Rubrivivax sp.]